MKKRKEGFHMHKKKVQAAMLAMAILMSVSSPAAVLADTVSNSGQELFRKAFLAAYVSGVPFNIIHGTSTVIFLFFLSIPMERKLDRIKKKYGILEV